MQNPKLLDYRAFLKRFTYKPNFGFFHFERDGKQWVKILMYVEDSRAPFRPWAVAGMDDDMGYTGSSYNPFKKMMYAEARPVMLVEGTYVLPTLMPGDEEMFKHFLIGCIHNIEKHEMYEWAKLDGELIDDPHKERPNFPMEESSV